MKYKIMVMTVIFVFVVLLEAPLVNAQDKGENRDINTNTYEPPPQGTLILCELCVILYPKQYEKEPEKCPVCQGAKEHFQAVQMMDREMARMRLHEIDVDIREFLHETLLDSLEEPVDIKQLKKLRKLYAQKLIHLLVHGFIEVESVKEKIIRLDEIIEK